MVTDISLFKSLRTIARHLPYRRRAQAIMIVLLMLAGAFAEVVTIGAILPFLALVSDPQALTRHPQIARGFEWLGVSPGGNMLVPAVVLFIVVALAAGAVRLFLTYASQKFIFRLGYDLGTALYDSVLHRTYSWHVKQNSSVMLTAMTKVQFIITGMMLPGLLGLTALIISTFMIIGLVAISPGIAAVCVGVFGAMYVGLSFTIRMRLRRNSKIVSAAQTARMKTVQEGLGGIRDILLDQAQSVYMAKYRQIDSAMRDAQATNALMGAAPRFVVETAGMVMIALLALYLSRQPGGLMASLPVLGTLALGAQRLLPLLQQIYLGWSVMLSGRQMLADVLLLLEGPPDDFVGRRRTQTLLPFRTSVAFRDVSFRYGAHLDPVLDQISLTIPKGARVGFIGKTGSGKSTIMDVLMGLLTPTDGAVLVDGVALDAETSSAWQEQVAHVPQAIYLADTSVLENIAFGVPEDRIDVARVKAAAKDADLAQFIETLPQGYNTAVGERGVRLSGGQRQRLGIARALYKQCSILVFDEATSALDDATEASVMSAIERLDPELTVLMIAHRLNTVRNCDLVVRLVDGRIAEQGSFDQVVGHAAAVPHA